MTVEDAAKVLANIPDVQSIEVASLKPGDVIVISTVRLVSMDTAKRIEVLLNQIWPNNKVIVLDDGATMKVVQS